MDPLWAHRVTSPFLAEQLIGGVGSRASATQIEWVEVSAGHWEAVCACGHEFFHEPLTDDRERLDPYDPSTFRHAGQCEHCFTSDTALLRANLKVRDGAGGGYWWVECATCEHGWQVPHYPQPPMRLMPPPK